MTAEEPKRRGCILCDAEHLGLLNDDVHEHVEQYHSVGDIVTTCIPINAPGELDSDISNGIVEGDCPMCEITVSNDMGKHLHRTLTRHIEAEHDLTDFYDTIVHALLSGYDFSPTYDNRDVDDPAATFNTLVPDDAVKFTVEEWHQSLGTPRGQTRDSINDDETWTGTGIVSSIEDSRDERGSFAEFREVDIHANTSIIDDPVHIMLETGQTAMSSSKWSRSSLKSMRPNAMGMAVQGISVVICSKSHASPGTNETDHPVKPQIL